MEQTYVVKASRFGFTQTVHEVERVLLRAGNRIFARIDQAAAARDAGLDLRPTMLIVFGDPRIGTPLMVERPEIGLELPFKILIWDAGGAVSVAMLLRSAYAHLIPPELMAAFEKIDARLAGIISDVVSPN